MGGLLSLSRGIDRVTALISSVVQWLILASILVSAGNATIRKVFDSSSNAWLELQWFLYGAAFLLAASHTLRQNEHIRIDIVYGMFSRRTQHWIDLLGHIFFLLPFVLIMTWLLAPYAWQGFQSGEGSSSAGGLPIWPARLFLLLGFALLILQAFSEIIKKISVMADVIPDPTPFVSSHEAALKEGEMTAAEIHK
jgi:TRAP-type mannitol/chloroaromatic compound transport system permease small subunit